MASSKGRPEICIESGSPEDEKPVGMARVGSPVMLNGPMFDLANGKSGSWTTLNAGAGPSAVGVISTSTVSSTRAVSSRIWARRRWACTYSSARNRPPAISFSRSTSP